MSVSQNPLSVVQALDAACNAHDIETTMSLFADDAEVKHTPPPDGVGIYRGKEQIRRWFEPQLRGFQVTSRDHRANGETIRWSALVTDDLLRQIGHDRPVEAEIEAVVREGKFVSFSVTNPSLVAGG